MQSCSDISNLQIAGYDPAHADYFYDPVAANEIVDFTESYLTLPKSNGIPFLLQPWQKTYYRLLHGYFHNETKKLRFTESYMLAGRGSGKTNMAAPICLFDLLCNPEQSKEIILAANTREQSEYLFDICVQMLHGHPTLYELVENKTLRILDSRKRIIHERSGSVLKAVSGEHKGRWGICPSLVCLDEIQAATTPDMYEALRTAMKKRQTGARMINITSAGHERGIAYDLFEYGLKIRDKVIDDPNFLPVLYFADSTLPIDEEETWRKALPNYGVTMTRQDLEQEAARAKTMVSYETSFRVFYLSQFQSVASRYLNMNDWDLCVLPKGEPEPDLSKLTGYGFIDLSDKLDLTCVLVIWPDGETVYVKSWFFIPQQQAKMRESTNRIKYESKWEKDPKANLCLTPGLRIDYRQVEQTIRDLSLQFNVELWGYDRYGTNMMVRNLEDDGFKMVAWGMNFPDMNAGTKELERLVTEHRIVNLGPNPVLSWCCSNLEVAQNTTGLLRPVKPEHKQATKVDGAVCLAGAIGLMMVSENSYYTPLAS